MPEAPLPPATLAQLHSVLQCPRLCLVEIKEQCQRLPMSVLDRHLLVHIQMVLHLQLNMTISHINKQVY